MVRGISRRYLALAWYGITKGELAHSWGAQLVASDVQFALIADRVLALATACSVWVLVDS